MPSKPWSSRLGIPISMFIPSLGMCQAPIQAQGSTVNQTSPCPVQQNSHYRGALVKTLDSWDKKKPWAKAVGDTRDGNIIALLWSVLCKKTLGTRGNYSICSCLHPQSSGPSLNKVWCRTFGWEWLNETNVPRRRELLHEAVSRSYASLNQPSPVFSHFISMQSVFQENTQLQSYTKVKKKVVRIYIAICKWIFFF